MNRQTCKLCRI